MSSLDRFRQTYFEECRERLEEAEQCLLTLERTPADAETVQALFRAIHSIKGGAGAFGFDILTRTCHDFEAVLDRARAGQLHLTAEHVSLLVLARDELANIVGALTAGQEPPTPALAAKLQAILTAENAPVLAGQQPLTPNPSPKPQPTATSSLRVDRDKLDRVVNLVGEMVITQAMLDVEARNLPTDRYPGLMKGFEHLVRQLRHLQDSVMAMRAQPLSVVFSRLPRIVRDAAQQLGKEVELVMAGETTEVDKSILEQLTEPLTHLVRNAVDHGIEMPEARRASGKPAAGLIRLSAQQKTGRILITLADDGQGINRAKVRAKAEAQGIVSPDATLSDAEIDALIFHPGLSTAAKVSDISGRGVGMDVVQQNIAALGGRVTVASVPGQGTTLTLSLPLSLAVIEGLAVEIANRPFIVPVAAVNESVRRDTVEVRTIPGQGEVVNVRGQFVPVLPVRRVLGLPPGPEPVLLFLDSEDGPCACPVDALAGLQQVVSKNLEDNYRATPGVSGATILGDGTVALILDPAGLLRAGLDRMAA